MPHNIKAMLVMAQERRSALVEALETCGFEVLPVCDCHEARRMLETEPLVQVVVTDARLHDGDWRRVIEIVARSRSSFVHAWAIPNCGSMSWIRVAMMCWPNPSSTKRYGELLKPPQAEVICAPPPKR
jgi:hypothetical protein